VENDFALRYEELHDSAKIDDIPAIGVAAQFGAMKIY